ncbi:MAG: 4-(cytidine 5'-diphospho)-2-C-methyl-D-erythritol kinase [Clostridiales bacterium]|nr:4-(cytidine 5'-diphospho)-2-C-methyl-D-erythritol kinase [Clostridiales bacterium]
MQITVKAHAKLNLTLDVTGRRPDGYHLLDMVVQSLDLADTVTLSTNTSGEILLRTNEKELPADENNIAYKAAALFYQTWGRTCEGLRISLKKRIPLAAGLGGGSADAAAVLLGLNRLNMQPFTKDQLEDMALELGADVPLCLTGGTLEAGGIGGILSPLPDLPDCWFALVRPGEKPSTGEMYRRYDALDTGRHPDTQGAVGAICGGDLEELGQKLYNVFEQVWQTTDMDTARRIMRERGALGVSLSGSGPTLFGLFANRDQAAKAAADLAQTFGDALVCEPVGAGCEIDD